MGCCLKHTKEEFNIPQQAKFMVGSQELERKNGQERG